jgi:serine/threonine protein phosphatase PrpC
MYKFENFIHMNVVNLGDSRLVIVNNDGSSLQITTDHKPDDPEEKKRIEKIGGQIYKDSEGVIRVGDLSLSRALGDADNEPYISQKPDCFYLKLLDTHKYIVMACDGLWDVIDTNNLGKIINNLIKKKSENLASDLAKYALDNNSTDNISVIVIEIN